METLQKRLIELRGERSQGMVAEYADIPQTTLSGWERRTALALENLTKLARYYNVSTDYLLGLVDTPTAIVLRERAREIKDWPPSVQELTDVASRLPGGIVESLITLARQYAEIVEGERQAVVQELVDTIRSRHGDAAAEQIRSFLREAVDVLE